MIFAGSDAGTASAEKPQGFAEFGFYKFHAQIAALFTREAIFRFCLDQFVAPAWRFRAKRQPVD